VTVLPRRVGTRSSIDRASAARVPASLLHWNWALVLRLVVALPLLWVVLLIAFNPQPEGTRYDPKATSGWDPVLTGALVLLGVVLLAVAVALAPWITRLAARSPHRARVAAACAGLAVLLAGQLALGHATAKTPSFDAGFVLGMSYAHAVPGMPVPVQTSADNYYSVFPNNLVLGGAFSALFFVANAILQPLQYGTAVMLAIAVNAVFLLGAFVLTLWCVRRLFGATSAAVIAPIAAVLLLASPWLNTPYSDTMGAVFPIAMLAMYLQWRDRLTGWSWHLAAIAVVAALGYALKPTLCFPFAAIVLVALWRSRPSRGGWRRFAVTIVVAAAPFIALHFGLLLAVKQAHLVAFDVFHPPAAISFTAFLAEGSKGFGGFDYGTFTAAANAGTPSQKFWFGLGEFWSNIAALGPFGYLQFLAQKFLWMLGDGSFFQGHEGDSFPAYFHTDPGSTAVRSFMTLGGAQHVWVASVWQASWTLLLVGVIVGAIVFPARVRTAVTLCFGSLALLFVFLLFFEGRSRYVYIDVPLMLVIAAGAVAVLADPAARSRAAQRFGMLVGRAPSDETAVGKPE
jgi:hypothetical protein